LVRRPFPKRPAPDDAALKAAASLDRAAQRQLGRSLSIRESMPGRATAASWNHALNNAFYDLERFGLRFVASPRRVMCSW
jgi:hypothetical protein